MRLARLGFALSLSLAGLGTASAANDVEIGVAAPLSGSDAVFGAQVRLGVEQAIADINAKGGFLGRHGRVVARDDGSDAKQAVDVAKAFVAAKIPIVIGDFSSVTTVAASAVYAQNNVLDITPSALAPTVTDRGLQTVFRTSGRDDQQVGVMVRFLLSHHLSRIAIVHDRSSAGTALADSARKLLSKAGVDDSFYGSFDKGTRDLSALANRIKNSGAAIVVFGGGPTEAGLLIRQLRDVNARATLIGGSSLASDDLPSSAGNAAEGTLVVFPRDPLTRAAAADLLRRLRAKGQEPETYVFYAYAAIQVVDEAARTAQSLDPLKLAEAMHSGRQFATVLGNLVFDAKGDPVMSDDAIYVWHKSAAGHMVLDDQVKS